MFHDPLPKKQKPFKDASQSGTLLKNNKEHSVEVNWDVHSCLVILSLTRGLALDFEKALHSLLSPIPISIVTPDDGRRVTVTRKLMDVIRSGCRQSIMICKSVIRSSKTKPSVMDIYLIAALRTMVEIPEI